jgi:hypothetical protein
MRQKANSIQAHGSRVMAQLWTEIFLLSQFCVAVYDIGVPEQCMVGCERKEARYDLATYRFLSV